MESQIITILENYGVLGVLLTALGVILYKFIDKLLQSMIPKIVQDPSLLNRSYSRKRRKDAVVKVSGILSDLMESLDADGAAIFEYHNGGHNLTNLPFLHFSATLLKTRVGVKELSHSLDNVFVSSVPDFINALDSVDIYNVDDVAMLEHSFPALYKELEKDGIKQVLLTNIVGIDDLIGFLLIGFKSTITKIPRKTRRIIHSKIQKIAILLDGKL